MESNVKQGVVFRSPRNEQERDEVAGTCVRKLGIKFPAVVDAFDNATEKAYTGWPDRIYLIDSAGRIVFKSKPGPFGFKPELLQAQLSRLLPDANRLRTGKRWEVILQVLRVLMRYKIS
jgi:type I thyroxine 5'-deiodinase